MANKQKLKKAIKEAEFKVRNELMDQWIKERDEFEQNLNNRVTEMWANEMEEFRKDIDDFRDLEAEYHIKLKKEKKKLAKILLKDLANFEKDFIDFVKMELEFARKESTMGDVMDSFIDSDSDRASAHFHQFIGQHAAKVEKARK